MLKTLLIILQDNWQWRKQIVRLAVFDLIKKARGTVFSWAWLFARPVVFILVFWFTLEIGLRAGADMDPPYFLWLVAGLIPWFFMQEMLGQGSDVLHRYSYLVTKIKFPISGIPTIYGVSTVAVHLGMVLVLVLISLVMGVPADIYLIQIPLVVLMMFAFFVVYSLMTSLLSALSKDFANLVRTLLTPLFWLSGVIFDPAKISYEWVRNALLLNPITFFAKAFRSTFYYKQWVWEDLPSLGGFAVVFAVTLMATLALYKRLSGEVPDAL